MKVKKTMNARKMSPEFLSLLSVMLSGGSPADLGFTLVEPKPGQSVEDAIEEARAKHREECTECRVAHEAEQRAQPDQATELRKELTPAAGAVAVIVDNIDMSIPPGNGKHFIIQTPPDSTLKVGDDLFDAAGAVNADELIKAAAPREPIGYMVFHGEKPVPGSFDTDRAALEKKQAGFDALPEVTMLRGLAGLFGRTNALQVEIKPVYGE